MIKTLRKFLIFKVRSSSLSLPSLHLLPESFRFCIQHMLFHPILLPYHLSFLALIQSFTLLFILYFTHFIQLLLGIPLTFFSSIAFLFLHVPASLLFLPSYYVQSTLHFELLFYSLFLFVQKKTIVSCLVLIASIHIL